MKKFVAISSAVMSLMLGITIPGYAQQDQKRDKQDHPDRQQPRSNQQIQNDDRQRQDQQQQQYQNRQDQAQQQKDENRQQEQRIQRIQDQDRQQQQGRQQQQRQDENRQQQQRAQQQHQERGQQESRQQDSPKYSREHRRVQESTWQDYRARNWQSDHRSWQQRGGYKGYHIPDDRYRGYFGPQHYFRISGLPFAVYGGYPRFQYQGYWITLLDTWPEYWSNKWYDNDDVYVDYDGDGYYMHNRRYPGVGIAIDITI